eukprot:m51a1_g10838 hypothetical protein (771) ;mRNA; f:623-2981
MRFFGLVDELSVWSQRLTELELAAVAGGASDVLPGRMVLRWACDEDAASDTVVADSSGGSGNATVVGGVVPKVPSTCPKISAGFTVVAVDSAEPTTLAFGQEIAIVSQPPSGLGSVEKVPGSNTDITYSPPRGGLGARVASFFVSTGQVIVQQNMPPAPQNITASIPDGTSFAVSAAYWRFTDTYSRDDMYVSDYEGEPLSATLLSTPSFGQVSQADGSPILPNQTVTASNLSVLVTTTAADYTRIVVLEFAVSDGLSSVYVRHTISVALPDVVPAPLPVSATADSSSQRSVAIDLAASPDLANESSFVVVGVPRLGRLTDASGNALVYGQRARLVKQWASRVLNVSSEANGPGGECNAQNILGKPRSYPEAGYSPFSWAPKPGGLAGEWVVLSFDEAVQVHTVVVYEVYNPGTVWRITVLDEDTQAWSVVYSRAKQTATSSSILASAQFSPELLAGFYPIRTRTARIDLFSPTAFAPQIDAVQLVGYQSVSVARMQSARRVYYTPSVGSSGTDTFQVGVELPLESSVAQRAAFWQSPPLADVKVSVTRSNAKPVAPSFAASVAFAEGFTSSPVAVSANDTDGSVAGYVLVSVPPVGSLSAAAGGGRPLGAGSTFQSPLWYSYSCVAPGVFTAAFRYRAYDNELLQSDTANATLRIFCAVVPASASSSTASSGSGAGLHSSSSSVPASAVPTTDDDGDGDDGKDAKIAGLIAGLVVALFVAVALAGVVAFLALRGQSPRAAGRSLDDQQQQPLPRIQEDTDSAIISSIRL